MHSLVIAVMIEVTLHYAYSSYCSHVRSYTALCLGQKYLKSVVNLTKSTSIIYGGGWEVVKLTDPLALYMVGGGR